MTLPFTQDQFFDVFGSYNLSLWPVVVALWLASFAALVSLVLGSQRSQRFINGLLVTHWLWAAAAYHLGFFSSINPAALLFGGLFVIQAGILVWYGFIRKRLHYSHRRSVRHVSSVGLIAYALVYPAIGWLEGFTYPRMPTFGIPCPTTILTIGFLLAAHRPWPSAVAAIPIAWAFIGGSASFLLGVHADLMLLVAGIGLTVYVLRTRQAKRAQGFKQLPDRDR
jgi:hypothetical protein